MQSAQLQTLSESPLAAKPQLSEKPRLGFETKKTAGKPGPSVCNFIVTLGLRATVIENGVRKTYSARYYNPNTGRFMSRDPEDGKIKIPATLHKYLYAGGDPVNRLDPRGRDSIIAYIQLQATVTAEVVTEWLVTKAVVADEIFNECMASLLGTVALAPDVYDIAKATCWALAFAVP